MQDEVDEAWHDRVPAGGGGGGREGESHIKVTGVIVGNFEKSP